MVWQELLASGVSVDDVKRIIFRLQLAVERGGESHLYMADILNTPEKAAAFNRCIAESKGFAE